MCGLFTEGGCERNAQCSAWVNDPDCASAPRLDSDGTRMDIYTQVRAAWTFSCPRRPDLLCTRRPVVQPPPRAPAAPTCSRTRRMEVYAQVPHGDTCTQVLRLKILVIHGWNADRILVDWTSAPRLSPTAQRSNIPTAQRSVQTLSPKAQRPHGPILNPTAQASNGPTAPASASTPIPVLVKIHVGLRSNAGQKWPTVGGVLTAARIDAHTGRTG